MFLCLWCISTASIYIITKYLPLTSSSNLPYPLSLSLYPMYTHATIIVALISPSHLFFSPLTLIVFCHRLKPLLSSPQCDTSVIDPILHYDLSALIFSLLFTMTFMHHSLCLSLLFSLLFKLLLDFSLLFWHPYSCYSPTHPNILSPLLSATFLSTCLHYAPFQSDLITPLGYVLSTMIAPLILLYSLSSMNCTEQSDWIG